jgi:hypothetical protein
LILQQKYRVRDEFWTALHPESDCRWNDNWTETLGPGRVESYIHASSMNGTQSNFAGNGDCSVDILDVSCEIRYGGTGIGSVLMILWFLESNPVE